jgi:hypothetical protein
MNKRKNGKLTLHEKNPVLFLISGLSCFSDAARKNDAEKQEK